MNFVSSFFPAFSFGKDLLLFLSLTFMAIGLTQTFYCYMKIKQLNGKLYTK